MKYDVTLTINGCEGATPEAAVRDFIEEVKRRPEEWAYIATGPLPDDAMTETAVAGCEALGQVR